MLPNIKNLPAAEKRKTAAWQITFHTYFLLAAVLRNQGRRFPFARRRISGTEGAAMLIRLAFRQNNFLKKACAQQGAASATSMNYTI